MINQTINESINVIALNLSAGGPIPINVVSTNTTNPGQFFISIIFTGFFVLYFIAKLWDPTTLLVKAQLIKLKRATKHHQLLIKHDPMGFFGQMISQVDIQKIEKAMVKFKGKPFDLIIQTPGGCLFSTMMISRMIKNYPGKIRAFIPSFAMSGGTVLALSCDEIYLGDSACLGPVDPQLGGLFSHGSANSWDHVVKMKGKKAEDKTIAYSLLGKQATKTVREYLDEIITLPMDTKDKKKFIDSITSGKVEHSYPLNARSLQASGLPVKTMGGWGRSLYSKILNTKSERTNIYSA